MHATRKSVFALRGELVQFNVSPKCVPEGMIVRRSDGDGGTVQVNFDPELSARVTATVSVGRQVVLDVEPSHDGHAEAHPVYALVRLTAVDGDGRTVVADGPAEAGVTVRGVVVRLNYARRGEVNGGILDTGDFVHLRPHGVKAVGGLSVGQVVEARGEVRSGWQGCRVVEATWANGVAIGKPPHKEPKGHGGPPKGLPHGGPKHDPHHGPGHVAAH